MKYFSLIKKRLQHKVFFSFLTALRKESAKKRKALKNFTEVIRVTVLEADRTAFLHSSSRQLLLNIPFCFPQLTSVISQSPLLDFFLSSLTRLHLTRLHSSMALRFACWPFDLLHAYSSLF